MTPRPSRKSSSRKGTATTTRRRSIISSSNAPLAEALSRRGGPNRPPHRPPTLVVRSGSALLSRTMRKMIMLDRKLGCGKLGGGKGSSGAVVFPLQQQQVQRQRTLSQEQEQEEVSMLLSQDQRLLSLIQIVSALSSSSEDINAANGGRKVGDYKH